MPLPGWLAKGLGIIEKTMPLLQAATSSEDLLFYPFMLRYLNDGWTLEQRKIAFEALNKAEKMTGASTFFKAISDTRSELAAALKPDEAVKLAQACPILAHGAQIEVRPIADLCRPMADVKAAQL